MENNIFKTAAGEASAEFTEKRSRFIGYIKPVANEEEAVDFIEKIKSRHWDAKHNAYAYCAGLGNELSQRYSDDGEPQGTAGMPVLDVIRKSGIMNTVIVVTRYFGGVLLGAPGLVRAYGKAASLALEQAGISEYILCDKLYLTVDYSFLSRFQREIPKRDWVINDIDYGEKVILTVMIKKDGLDEFKNFATELTNGGCQVVFNNESEYIKI